MFNRYLLKKVFFYICVIAGCMGICSCQRNDIGQSEKANTSVQSEMHSGESTEKQGNAEPTSPADEIHDLETEEIKDPSEAEVIEPIAGVKDMEGKQVLEALAEYGFSVDEGLEAPDGTRSWTLQSGDYFCDMQADVNGNIYNAVFNTTSENYEAFLSDCAGVFSKDAKSWVVENVNKDAETEIEEFVVSISEGPGGYSLQVCSKDYRETVVGPQ